MGKRYGIKRYGIICVVIVSFAMTNFSYEKLPEENHPPVIEILTPTNNAVIDAGAPLSYRLRVSDKEDGDSQFDEINAKEVLLEVKYTKTVAQSSTPKNTTDDPPGLAVIRTSNCFNCHGFNSKSIGPSFFEISKRYLSTKANTDTLVRNIKNGSANIWGKEKMPSHPELTADEIKSSVQWILKNGVSQNVNYYNAIAGMIQFPANKKGNYVLTASYIDHGIKGVVSKHLKGVDMVVVNVK